MSDGLISFPRGDDHVFVYLPPELDRPYLEQALSRALGKDVSVSSCVTTNLCAGQWGGVSNSGATVLHLALDLGDAGPLDAVLKILSPDPVNLFQADRTYSARLAEVAWARWWGEQQVPFVARVYGTRADPKRRAFWILHERFAQVGWPGVPVEGMKHFSTALPRLEQLLEQVATLHAYSANHVDDLLLRFAGQGVRPGHLCAPSDLWQALTALIEDGPFLKQIGVTDDEQRLLASYRDAVERRPAWVGEWEVVCATADWAPDNFGFREGEPSVPVTFDWGTTRLAPMEEDLAVLLGRIGELDEGTREALVRRYLRAYAEKTGHEIEYRVFMARVPWARFLVHLRYIIEHADVLRWVPFQARSVEFVHLFAGLCDRLLAECRRA